MKIVVPPHWMGTMGIGTRVMVIDSGFNPGLILARPPILRSFVSGTHTEDAHAHGTEVVSIIASNDPTWLGKAPQCQIYVAKIVHGITRTLQPVVEALDWAIEAGVDVVNMSFTYSHKNEEVLQRLEELDRRGVICVASHSDTTGFPHSHSSVIAVGRLGRAGAGAVRAPDCVVRTSPRAGRADFKGTSVAAAIVAGVAACAKGYDRGINRERFVRELKGRL